jgi:hypothetical protein
MITRRASKAGPTADQVRAFNVHTPYAELDRQHEILRARLAALQQAASAEATVDEKELLQQVQAVRSSLALHFSFEENVGTLSFLSRAHPALQPEIERLRTEHAGFLTILDRVAVELWSGKNAPNVGGALLSVLDRLVEHELDERQLCRTALRAELGQRPRVPAGPSRRA